MGVDMTCFETERQLVNLRRVSLAGRVLDIGGGGEGIIARHSGEAVVAIDKRKDELAETPDIGLKMVMDARETPFLDESFETVTCFYSLLYMDREEIQSVLKEARRVLKPQGRLWIWDAIMPFPATADAFVIQLDIRISESQSVSTGYGVGWQRGQSLAEMAQLCEEAGFVVEVREKEGHCFSICARKE